jgi:hypothetical protein
VYRHVCGGLWWFAKKIPYGRGYGYRRVRGVKPNRAGRLASKSRSTEEDTVATKADTYNGYCVKCKQKRDFEGTVEVSKTGMNVAKGKCPVCGTTMNRILGKASA